MHTVSGYWWIVDYWKTQQVLNLTDQKERKHLPCSPSSVSLCQTNGFTAALSWRETGFVSGQHITHRHGWRGSEWSDTSSCAEQRNEWCFWQEKTGDKSEARWWWGWICCFQHLNGKNKTERWFKTKITKRKYHAVDFYNPLSTSYTTL